MRIGRNGQMERSISIGPVQPKKKVHLEKWTTFFETFPVGPNQSIERCLTFADCRLQTADCRLQTADCRLADCRLQTADCRLKTADYRLQITDCKQWTSDRRLQETITDRRPQILKTAELNPTQILVVLNDQVKEVGGMC